MESKMKCEMVRNNLREYSNWYLFFKYVLSGVLMRNLYLKEVVTKGGVLFQDNSNKTNKFSNLNLCYTGTLLNL